MLSFFTNKDKQFATGGNMSMTTLGIRSIKLGKSQKVRCKNRACGATLRPEMQVVVFTDPKTSCNYYFCDQSCFEVGNLIRVTC